MPIPERSLCHGDVPEDEPYSKPVPPMKPPKDLQAWSIRPDLPNPASLQFWRHVGSCYLTLPQSGWNSGERNPLRCPISPPPLLSPAARHLGPGLWPGLMGLGSFKAGRLQNSKTGETYIDL